MISILLLSLSGTISFCLTRLAVTLCGRHITNKTKYYIWIVPLLAFILPISANLGFHIRSDLPVQTAPVQQIQQPQQPDNDMPSEPKAEVQQTEAAPQVQADAQPEAAQTYTFSSLVPYAKTAGFSLYLLVLCGLILYSVYSNIHTRRSLRRLWREASEDDRRVLTETAAHMNIRRIPRLKMIRTETSPFITGIWNPVIVLPDSITETQLIPVLEHELTHLARHDLLYRMIAKDIALLHWFNPFVYFTLHQIERYMELSCDEAVAALLDFDARKSYGTSILTLMKHNMQPQTSAAFLSENGKYVKQRLEVIMNTKKFGYGARLISLIMAIVMICSTTVFAASVNSRGGTSGGIYRTEGYTALSYSYRAPDENEAEDVKNQKAANCGGGRAVTEASLVATPFYKSFYATAVVDKYENHKAVTSWSGTDEFPTIQASFEVRMDEFIRATNNGKNWIGTFSATMNGETIFDHVTGMLANVPPSKEDMTTLSIDDFESGFSMRIARINFNISGEDIILADKADEAKENEFYNHADTQKINGLHWNTDVEMMAPSELMTTEKPKPSDDAYTWYYNKTTRQVKFYVYTPMFTVRTDLDDRFDFNGNDVSGVVHIGLSSRGDGSYEDVKGTFSNLLGAVGEQAIFTSDDGRYRITCDIVTPTFNPFRTEERDQEVDSEFLTPYEQFRKDQTSENSRIACADFPFDVKLSDDNTYITLTFRPSEYYANWMLTEATYNDSDEANIWEEKRMSDNQNTFTLPVYTDGSRHYLNFSGYSFSPATITDMELAFFVADGELLYSNGSKLVRVNDVISDADAEKAFASSFRF